MYERSPLLEKTELLQERQIWLGFLSIPDVSCFNASLLRYTLQIHFVFKKLILRKSKVQTSVNYPMQSVLPSSSCLNQELG